MRAALAIVLLGIITPAAESLAVDDKSSPWQRVLADMDENIVLQGDWSADRSLTSKLLHDPDRVSLALAALETASEPSIAHPAHREGSHEGALQLLMRMQSQSMVVAIVLLGLIFVATLPILRYQGVLPFLSVISYIACLCMVKICVKDLFVSNYRYPYTVTTLHMLFTAIVASMIDFPRRSEGKSTFALSLVKAASLGLNNMALVFGTTAFVSIIGSCTPASTYLVELVRYRSPTFCRTVGVLAVCGGTMMCIHGELSFSMLALGLSTGACFCRSLKAVWSHDLLAINMSAYRLAAWSSIWSFLFMLVPALVQEGLEPYRVLPSASTHVKLVLAASCAIATWLNIVMCFCLKYLGPVQQNVFGQLELLAVIVLATILLHEVVTPIEWMGVLLIIAGCLFTKMDDKLRQWRQKLWFEPKCSDETKRLIP